MYIVLLLLFVILIMYLFINLPFVHKLVDPEPKKIALCFLIYDKINHEKLWYDWLKHVDKNKYTIYIHYKENKPLKYFEKYKIKENIPTEWGDVSLIHAHNLLFKNALHHNNYKIISLSQSCIPVKSFDYLYDFLINDNYGYFAKEPHSQNFPRCNELLHYYDKETIQKSSEWFILNRPLAKLVTSISKEKIDRMYGDITCPEEHYFITHIYEHNLQNQIKFTHNSSYATTFASWPDHSDYKIFDKSKLSKNTPKEYDEICDEELEYLVDSNSLFARKFNENCNLQYLYKLLSM